jgi:hypothetical protein
VHSIELIILSLWCSFLYLACLACQTIWSEITHFLSRCRPVLVIYCVHKSRTWTANMPSQDVRHMVRGLLGFGRTWRILPSHIHWHQLSHTCVKDCMGFHPQPTHVENLGFPCHWGQLSQTCVKDCMGFHPQPTHLENLGFPCHWGQLSHTCVKDSRSHSLSVGRLPSSCVSLGWYIRTRHLDVKTNSEEITWLWGRHTILSYLLHTSWNR